MFLLRNNDEPSFPRRRESPYYWGIAGQARNDDTIKLSTIKLSNYNVQQRIISQMGSGHITVAIYTTVFVSYSAYQSGKSG